MLIDRKSQRHRPINLRSGFTLIELLIVIGVIVVLIALLLPSVASVRARARSAECQSNLAQLGLALNAANRNRSTPLTAVDGNGNLWSAQIAPFLEGEDGELFLCPADPNTVDLEDDQRDPQNAAFQPSFGANSQMHRMQGSDANKITVLDLGDGDGDGNNDSVVHVVVPEEDTDTNWTTNVNGQQAFNAGIDEAATRHAGNVNVLRHDGSVAAEATDDLVQNHPAQAGSNDWIPWRTPSDSDATVWDAPAPEDNDDIDRDGDGIANDQDNCPDKYNPSQGPCEEEAGEGAGGDGGGGTGDDDLGHDDDEDGISSNGDGSDSAGDNPCGPGQSENCDDNCPDTYNPDQTDHNENGDYCDDFGEDNCYNAISGFPELAGWYVQVHTMNYPLTDANVDSGHYHQMPLDDPNHARVQVIQDTDCYYEINLEDAGDWDYDTRLILNRLGNGDISFVYKFNPGDGTVFPHSLWGTLPDGTPFIEAVGRGGTHSFMIPGGNDAAYCECAGAGGSGGGGSGGEEGDNCTLWAYNLGGEEYLGSEDLGGITFQNGFTASPMGGLPVTAVEGGSGTADDPLWQQCQFSPPNGGGFALEIPVCEAGQYLVTLWGGHTLYKTKQDIIIEGQTVISEWQPYPDTLIDAPGYGSPGPPPYMQTATVEVNDGKLNIAVTSSPGWYPQFSQTMLSAIKIEKQ